MGQISDIAELFDYEVRERGNKFAHKASQVKQLYYRLYYAGCFCFIYNQSLLIELSSGGYGGKYIISVFLGTFKFLDLC
nr:hypothetical protein [Wolbachia endosymbiont of Litomosoides brasiliensis]